VNAEPPLDLDLNLPFHDEPFFPPPQLDTKNYVRFVEFCRQVLIENGQLEGVIANRPRPVEEMFVLK
jgi:hypothetical protein